MNSKSLRVVAIVFVICLRSAGLVRGADPTRLKPVGLQCDSLVEPLGIDDAKPLLSWRLQDGRWGAVQTAYAVQVASTAALLAAGKADVWDSERVTSNQSVGVAYAGAALEPSRRYYWRVKAWDMAGHAYPASDISWWETGLMEAASWKGKWIGYEGEEHRRMRESGAAWVTNPAVADYKESSDSNHDFRLHFNVAKPVKRAVLYVTGKDTVAAWVNGQQVLKAQPLTPWRQMPWETYSRVDVTTGLRQGGNLLAVGITRYHLQSIALSGADSRSPMSACVYVEASDGSVTLFVSDAQNWKASLNAEGDWFRGDYDDSTWASAQIYTAAAGFGDGQPGNPWPTDSVMILRHGFQVEKPVLSARLYATALGAYKFHLNGHVVGDEILSPGWMDYREHVPYQAYDVTTQLKAGANAMASYLAPGWYTTPLKWYRQPYNYGSTPPALKAQLRIEYTDGSIQWVVTDETWKADVSAILSSEIYDGETYDARRVQAGWDSASFLDSSWHQAPVISPSPEPGIVPQNFPPIREQKALSAKAVTSPAPGVYIFDFGQNLAGVPRVRLRGTAGTDVRLRFAEVLNADGTMYVENLRSAKATDHFILAGTGAEEFQPQFTFHGFRYIEVSGVRAKPSIDSVKAIVLHTDAPFTAELHTGSRMIDQLWSNILWGQRSNFVGVPTDCPQRDERLGWTADAQVFWRTASYNMDLNSFTQKFATDLRGTQSGTPMYGIFAPGVDVASPGFGAGWSDAGVIIPWIGWIQRGDKRVIEQNWAAMETYLSAIHDANPDYLWRKQFGIPFGDWLTPTQTTPEDLVATAYWAYDVSLMRDMAAATGRTADVQKYGELFEKIKTAFIKAYVRPDGFVGSVDLYPSIPPPTVTPVKEAETKNRPVETQTGYVLALHMKLLPEELRAAAAMRLVKKIEDNHWLLGTGFLGTPYLLEVLSDTGHSDVAYRLLLNNEYPSWGYLIEHGATTTWERWNGDQMRQDPSMNSYNHYAYGAVAEWIYRYSAGVDTTTADAGFHTIYLHPNFDSRLGNLDFSYQSVYGTVRSAWTVKGDEARWNVTLPPNTKGQLRLAEIGAESLTLDGLDLARSDKVHAAADGAFELPAGTYSFRARIRSSAKGFERSSR